MSNNKPRIIAFYLPQFHPIPENDEWWGKGFTEWTNVGKAKPLFWGHKQPKVPTDLGYYDLRLSETYDEQVKLAKEAGVYGFCFWHYYFGDGKQLLEKPLQRIVQSKQNDFPFCLGWANESWEKKLWNKDSSGNTVLIEQKYNGFQDYKTHFEIIKPMIQDSRYINIDGKPLFFIYRPDKIPNCKEFIYYWRRFIKESLKKDFHFIAQATENETNFSKYFEMGFDSIYSNRVQAGAKWLQSNIFNTIKYTVCRFLGLPRLVDFRDVIKKAVNDMDKSENIYPGIICGWDHTPRSGRKGYVYYNFSIPLFKKHIKNILDLVKNKNDEHKIIFLKSWNEWGEGNFMEPDIEFKKEKILALKEVLSRQQTADSRQQTADSRQQTIM